MGKRGLFGGVMLLVAAFAVAGSASADSSGWPPRGDDRDRNDSAYSDGAPDVIGLVNSVSRDRRIIEVQTRDGVYLVDVSERPESEKRELRRDARIEAWGKRVSGRSLIATRLRVSSGGWNRNDYQPNGPRDDDWRRPTTKPGQGLPGYGGDGHRPPDGHTNGSNPNDRYDSREERLAGTVRRRTSLFNRDLVITADGQDWTIQVPKDTTIQRDRENISVHDLRSGERVRVSGERTGERKFRASSIRVMPEGYRPADDERKPVANQHQPSDDQRWPADDARKPAETLSFTGSIGSIDTRGGVLTVRLNAFESYTVHAAQRTTIRWRGRDLSLSELRTDDRVRVQAVRDPRSHSIEADSIEVQ